MKYSIALVAAGAAIVAAQDISSLPECGVSNYFINCAAIGYLALPKMLNALCDRSTRPELG
jgi:hypothetical protein